MTNYPESGIKLIADTDSYTKAMEEAIFLADYFDSIGNLSIEVTADVSEAESALEDLPLSDETVDFTVNVDQTGDEIDDVTSLTDETVTETVDVVKTDTAEKTLSAVETLKNLKVIETVWNIAGTAVDIIGKFGSYAVTPMLDLEEAVAKVNAQTASGIPNARTLIKDIFYDDLGESIGQVGDLVTKAYQIKAPVDEATRAVLAFTHTFTDQNPETVLNTLNQLVANKLAPDFKTAGDLLTTAFQNGANRGNDLLATLDKNATAIHDLGLDAPQALGFIKTGLDAGYTSAEAVLASLTKIKQNVTNAAGNADSDVSKTLKILGIANPAETGEAWSAEFFKKVIDGIKNAPGLSDTEKEALFTNLVGGKQGGKTFSSFLQLSAADADTIFANVQGASERAAATMDDSLRGAIDDFVKETELAVENWLSSSAVDLPGKISALKEGLQNGLAVLQNGGTLEDALTIALEPIGLADAFQGFESMLGNVVIAILQVASQLQSLDPANWDAKKGTDATIAKMGATQLTFDLKIGNPDDLTNNIQTAISRGVSPEEITKSVGTAINELIADGSEAALAKAQALIDTLSAPIDMNNVPLLANGTPMNVEPVVTTEAIDGFQAQIDAAKPVTVKVSPDPDSAFMDSLIPMAESTSGLSDSAVVATESVDALNVSTGTQTTNTTTAALQVRTLADNTKKYGDAAKNAAGGISDAAYQMSVISGVAPSAKAGLEGIVTALDAILAKANAVGVAADGLAKKSAANNTGNTSGYDSNLPGGGAASGASNAIGTFKVGEQGMEIASTNTELAILNNMTTESIMAAIRGYTPSGSFSKSNGNSYSVNNVNYVQSEAQADALGYSTAKTLRGMA